MVACTTNLFGELDQAVLRRFAFKVELFPLRPAKAAVLFEELLAPHLGGPLDAGSRRAVIGRAAAPVWAHPRGLRGGGAADGVRWREG